MDRFNRDSNRVLSEARVARCIVDRMDDSISEGEKSSMQMTSSTPFGRIKSERCKRRRDISPRMGFSNPTARNRSTSASEFSNSSSWRMSRSKAQARSMLRASFVVSHRCSLYLSNRDRFKSARSVAASSSSLTTASMKSVPPSFSTAGREVFKMSLSIGDSGFDIGGLEANSCI